MSESTVGRASSPSEPVVGEPYLFLVLDGNRPGDPLWRHALGEVDEIHVGRGVERVIRRSHEGDKQHLHLHFPDPWMSSKHAHLVRTGKGLTMTDPDSKNGSFVNGVRLTNAVLTDGDILQFGHTFFIFREELPAAPDFPPDHVSDLDTPPGLASMLAPLSDGFVTFARAAVGPTHLLIEGEAGTGKSMLARSAHTLSGRAGELVTITLGDLSELGFEKKLRGSRSTGVGAVAKASGGTLVLENVDKLSLRSQAALSSVLHKGEIQPMDESPAVPLECRIISTSTASLSDMVANGRFESFLATQLAGFRLFLPPLRQRREDIGLLIRDMLEHSSSTTDPISFSSEAAYTILSYAWPRNLRELESCIATALAWRTSGMIDMPHLPPELHKPTDFDRQAGGDTIDTVELVQQDLEKRANIIASLRARSGYMFGSNDTAEQMRSRFNRWLARANADVNADTSDD